MTIHVIHLPHRKDRLQMFQKELATQNISDYRIWNGIIDEEIPCRGISRAHKQIISHARELALQRIIIAEDDLHFTAAGAFDYFIESIPSEYDMFIGGITWGKIKKDNTVGDFSGTAFYLVHEKFYDRFLSIPEEKDLDRSFAGKGKFVVCQPMVVTQHNGFSDHYKRYMNLEQLFSKHKLFGDSPIT